MTIQQLYKFIITQLEVNELNSLPYWKYFDFGEIFMPITCKYNCGRKVDIGISEADSCRDISTENVYNIILMSKGSLTLRINGQRIMGVAPCVWAMKENLIVKFVSSQKLSAQSIRFDVAFLYRSATFKTVNSGEYENLMSKLDLVPLNVFYKRSEAFVYVLPLSAVEFAQTNSFFVNFFNTVLNQKYSRWSCQARQNLNGLLELIHQVYMDFINLDMQNLDIRNPQAWVQILLKKIHANYSNSCNNLSLVPLAKEIGINKDTVSKKFKEIVGCSVGNYIIDYRIKCACRSLGNTDGTIKEIADKCGFGNEAYFIRQFQKRKGMLPTQYRKNALKLRQTELSSVKE